MEPVHVGLFKDFQIVEQDMGTHTLKRLIPSSRMNIDFN